MVSVGIYVRLSDEDRDKLNATDESESVQNQKAMLNDYCKERNWDVFDIYCDEDYSGSDRTRPDFNRLLADCEKGCIDIVLCKSQSRFARDLELIERYLHDKFIEWNVRFISVVDRADTNEAGNKKSRQINGLVNEWYSEDTSESICKTLESKRKRGEFTGSFASYGYLVDPDDKNHLVVDGYAAPIVRDIFDWYLQGWGYRKISMRLNELGIPSPTLYKQRLNSKYVNANAEKSSSKGLWTHPTIYSIIRNETYTGTLVQGKSHFVSYKNHKKKKVPKDEWIRVPNCHEPIIDLETWAKTQEKLLGKVRACKTTLEVSPLAGKVKCGVCGRAMKRNVYYNKKRTIQYYNLTCGTYKTGAMNCSNTAAISGLQLENALVTQINGWIQGYCSKDDIQIQSEAESRLERLKTEAENVKADKLKIDGRLSSLYEDKLDGVITKEQFILLSRKYESEKADLETKLQKLEAQAEKIRQAASDNDGRAKLVEKYTNIAKLTRTIADEFIDGILIGEKIDGKEREITVHWAF